MLLKLEVRSEKARENVDRVLAGKLGLYLLIGIIDDNFGVFKQPVRTDRKIVFSGYPS